MMFAEAEWWSGPSWAAIGVVLTGLGAWVLQLIKERNSANKERRVDAIEEWGRLHEIQQNQINAQQVQILSLTSQVLVLTEKHARCEANEATMKQEIAELRSIVFQLQKGCTLPDGCPLMKDFIKSNSGPALVTVTSL